MTRLRRTWALVLGVTLVSALTAWWSASAPGKDTSFTTRRALERVTLEHDDQRVELTLTQGSRALLTLTRQGKEPVRHMVSAQKTRALWDTFESPKGLPFVDLPSPGALDVYGLDPKTRATLTLKWKGVGAPTRWMIGEQRFGSGGFYALDERGRVGTLTSPPLRWMRYAMTHLPSNEVVEWSHEAIARVETLAPGGQPVVGTHHQLDSPDYAYWQWEGREGASTVLARWVRELLRVKVRGPLKDSLPSRAKDVLRATFTDAQGDEVLVTWAMDDETGWVSARTLDGLWAPVRRQDVARLVARHAEVADAAEHETLYTPLAPGSDAHQGHAHE